MGGIVMNKIVILGGPSGGGKNVTAQAVFFPKQKLKTSTSRTPRDGEVDGVDYYFNSKEEFLHQLSQDLFIEHDYFVGNYYGLSKKEFDEKIQQSDVYIILNAAGVKKYKKIFPDAIAIFLDVDLEESILNMKERGDTEENIERRIQEYRSESECKPYCDHIILNKRGHLDETIQQVRDIISSVNK